MKIIAIVVTYNGMKWYSNCFDSLRNSTIPIETIVVDNNSEDDTVKFIKENYPEIVLFESESNQGFGKANNIGLGYAIEQNADFVFLLNQDAWILPDTIEKLVEKMDENPEYGILSPIHLSGDGSRLDHGFQYYIHPEGCPEFISDFVVKRKAEDRIYPIKFVNAALWLISRKCLHEIGGFEPLFPHYGEDVNYISRCDYHKWKTGIYPSVMGFHDRNIKDSSKLTYTQKKNMILVNSLIELTNINESYFLCIRRALVPNIVASIKKLLKFSFNEWWLYTSVFFNLGILLYKIQRQRKISKKKGLSFL